MCATTLLPLGGALASGGDEAIIVTARKRAEQSIRVPVIASLIDKAQLDATQATDLFDVAALTPGLVLGASSIEVGTEVSLRGVGSTLLDPGVDQSVALNLDGLQIGQGAAYRVGIFDMERVEVLKGPQPLFFGKNSPGGVVAIRTADPGRAVEMIGSTAYESVADTWQSQLILSGPITETLGLRLSSQYSSTKGFFRNTAVAIPETGARQPDDRFGRGHSLYLRLSALFTPDPSFSARVKLNATHDRTLGGVQEQLVYCPEGTSNYLPAIGIAIPSLFSPNEDCRANRKLNIVDLDPRNFRGVTNKGVGFTNTDQRFATVETNWSFAPGSTLTSLTGFYHLDLDGLQNGPWSGGAAPPLAVTKRFSREEASQEVRLDFEPDGPFDFTAGGLAQKASIHSETSVPGNTAYGLPEVVLQGSHDLRIRSFALWGQVRYRPASQLEIAAGTRWTDERRSDHAVTFDVTGVATGVQGTAITPKLPRLHASNWSPEFSISWFPMDDLTVFASVKQGYKSGSYNINLPLNPGEQNSFGDERARGGEAGARGYAADRQFFFDVAGYFYRYTGLQVGIAHFTPSGIPTLTTFNAGTAKVYGVDASFRYRPRPIAGFSLSGAVNWNRARFIRFLNAPCHVGQTVAEGCNLLPVTVADPSEIAAGYFTIDPASGKPVRYNAQDLSGTRLPRAPAWQASLNADYGAPLGRELKFGLGSRVQFSSSYLVNPGRREHSFQRGFAKLGASVRLGSADDRWEVAIIGDNLTNRLTTGGCYDINYAGGSAFPGVVTGAPIRGPAGSGEVLCGYEQGRAFWLRLTLRPLS